MIAEALRDYLLTKSAITNLIIARIYIDTVEQGVALPAIRCSLITGGSEHQHGSKITGKGFSVYQIDSYAISTAAAETLGEAIRKNLQQFKGTWGAFFISNITRTDGRHASDMPRDGSASIRKIYSQQFRIGHSEPAVSI